MGVYDPDGMLWSNWCQDMEEEMAITQNYKTSDGHEFDTAKDAEKHQAVVDAKAAYEEAARNLSIALAESATTADGVPFSWDQWTYCYLFKPHKSPPRLKKVSFYRWHVNVGEYNDKLRIGQQETDDWGKHEKRYCEYDFDQLYADEEKAKEALRDAQAEWLQQLNSDFAHGRL